MNYIEAKNTILSVFSKIPQKPPNNLSHNDYKTLLDLICEYELPSNQQESYAFINFAYCGCGAFDRWFAPSPVVCNDEYDKLFIRFMQLLEIYEKGKTQNLFTFMVHRLKTEIFNEMSGCFLPKKKCIAYLKELDMIPKPEDQVKLKEFESEHSKVKKLLEAAINRNLKTIISTSIPYILHFNNLNVLTKWKELDVSIQTRNEFIECSEYSELFKIKDKITIPVGPTRWPAGLSRIEITIEGLLDASRRAMPLQVFDAVTLPEDGWPQSFVVAFQIIHNIAWKLRLEHGGETQWIPAPRDIGVLTWEVFAGGDRIEVKKNGPPAGLAKVFLSKPQGTIKIDLGSIEEPPWHLKSRTMAINFLQVGETNEALFWLNVAVENLLKERVKQIALDSGREKIIDEIYSAKPIWSEAEEILKKQKPEWAGKIEWPSDERHLSWFSKLNYIFKKFDEELICPKKMLIKKYKIVWNYRNALFHGIQDGRVPASEVKKAITAYDWIVEHFTYKEP